ncbi:MAG: helix-turn-helix domain-containing protein [Bacteroidota bacterium]
MDITIKLPEEIILLINKVDNIERLLANQIKENHPESEKPLTVPQAADYLSVSIGTIRRLASTGKLPVMKDTKRCYFLKTALIEYLKNNTRCQFSIESKIDKFLSSRIKKGGYHG